MTHAMNDSMYKKELKHDSYKNATALMKHRTLNMKEKVSWQLTIDITWDSKNIKFFLFQPKTTVVRLLHLMVFMCKVFTNHFNGESLNNYDKI